MDGFHNSFAVKLMTIEAATGKVSVGNCSALSASPFVKPAVDFYAGFVGGPADWLHSYVWSFHGNIMPVACDAGDLDDEAHHVGQLLQLDF